MALKNPVLSNPIAVDIPKLNEILDALIKANPTDVDGISTGAMRLYEVSSGKWQWQLYNGTSWAPVPFLQHNVDQLDGYHAAITPAANTVAARNASGVLEDSITGNAATASSAATLSQTLPVNKGGTGATTSDAARSNLGVPPTSHASANTTHGVGNATQYGHLKLSDATNSSSGVTGGVAATPAAVKAAKEAADAAQSSANNAKSSADAAMTKASTLATSSAPGIVKPGTGMTVGSDGALNVDLNNTVTSTSTTQAATANAVKTAYDKAVEANAAAGITKLFNSRIVITKSNSAWTPPATGWARVTVIGGGGAGTSWLAGSGSQLAWGKPGGDTKFGTITARGGATSRALPNSATIAGRYRVGGGCAGEVKTEYIYLDKSSPVKITIGAGGIAGAGTSTSGYTGNPGSDTVNDSVGSAQQAWGGNGGRTGLGYGGGGGACGLTWGAEYAPCNPHSPGYGHDGGKNAVDAASTPLIGGNGGQGAVIIEYYDPAKEGA